MTDEDKGEMDQKSCMQKHKNVMCYKCGKKVPVGTAMISNSSLLNNRSNHSTRPNRIGSSG
jgi:hypothetical protein